MRCAQTRKDKDKGTLINRDLIVNMIRFLLLLLEYRSGRLDIFVFEEAVLYNG